MFQSNEYLKLEDAIFFFFFKEGFIILESQYLGNIILIILTQKKNKFLN